MPQVHLRTLCFIRDGDRVLLIRRTHPPNVGMFNAVGGKIEPGENPYQACLREVKEETGLSLQKASLRAIVTVLVLETLDRWILFTYIAERPPGQEVVPSLEGSLQWVPLEKVPTLPVPPDIPLLLPYLFKEGAVVFVKVMYAREENPTPLYAMISSHPLRRL
ncbi:MAG: 8-oxo-dGTP diphosphatase [Armatimonadota bacterium]|nr:8-oxo-dGTP diphosphatase [Armatimonadota bacterium]